MRRLLLLPACVLLLSCTLPTEPMGFEFAVERQGVIASVAPALSVEAPGRVEALGSLRTPCLPYDATGSLRHESRTITLTVIGEARGDCPQDAVGTLIYRAAVKYLPAGYYTVRLVHAYRDANWPSELVLQRRLRVE
jgi:hypothetical protein